MRLLTPSGAERWYHCAASITRQSESREDKFALKGHNQHALIEKFVEGFKKGDISDLDLRDVWFFCQYLTAKFNKESINGVEIHSEIFLTQQGELRCDEDYRISGTADIVMEYFDHLEVVDYKSGYQNVNIKDNLQLILYAYMAEQHFKKPCKLITIIQNEYVKQQEIDFSDQEDSATIALKHLLKYQAYLNEFQHEVNAGEWCRYCTFKFSCKAYAMTVSPMVQLLPNPREVDNTTLGMLFNIKEFLADYMKEVEAELRERMIKNSEEVPGYKVIEGTGRRAWSIPTVEVFEFFKSQGYEEDVLLKKELKSFTEIEKIDEKAKALVESKTIKKKGLRIVEESHPSMSFNQSLLLDAIE